MRKGNSDEPRDLFPGALEMMILQILRRGPLHGYALAQQIQQASDGLLSIGEGSLYPALQRMLVSDRSCDRRRRSERDRRRSDYGRHPAHREHAAPTQ